MIVPIDSFIDLYIFFYLFVCLFVCKFILTTECRWHWPRTGLSLFIEYFFKCHLNVARHTQSHFLDHCFVCVVRCARERITVHTVNFSSSDTIVIFTVDFCMIISSHQHAHPMYLILYLCLCVRVWVCGYFHLKFNKC